MKKIKTGVTLQSVLNLGLLVPLFFPQFYFFYRAPLPGIISQPTTVRNNSTFIFPAWSRLWFIIFIGSGKP